MKKTNVFFVLFFAIGLTNQLYAQVSLADSLFKKGQWASAAKEYNNYLQNNPKDKPGLQLNKIGQCYFNLQQYEESIAAYKKSVGYNGSSGIMYNIACIYNKLSQKDSALVWLDNAVTAGYTQYQSTLDDEDLINLKDDAKFKTILEKIKKSFSPCSFQPESHLFNFWIGEWKVYNLQGQQTGTSKIEQILNECVIQENWTDYFGNKGKSFNFYNADTKQWQQTWVDDKGSVIEFINGKYNDNAMRFHSSRQLISNGKKCNRRLSFFNINENEVRQLGEISFDNGNTWTIEYDFKYIREK
ncbi:MAG: tetratricopeptide repeat protein [Chitinophagales bacterium]|nr:tetratricopeptide repeat protein [Chitinophagales bacterium]